MRLSLACKLSVTVPASVSLFGCVHACPGSECLCVVEVVFRSQSKNRTLTYRNQTHPHPPDAPASQLPCGEMQPGAHRPDDHEKLYAGSACYAGRFGTTSHWRCLVSGRACTAARISVGVPPQQEDPWGRLRSRSNRSTSVAACGSASWTDARIIPEAAR